MAPRLELRKGARVRYRVPVEDTWSQGELLRGSTTGEEWLVKDRFGLFWVPVTQLRPSEEPQPGQ